MDIVSIPLWGILREYLYVTYSLVLECSFFLSFLCSAVSRIIYLNLIQISLFWLFDYGKGELSLVTISDACMSFQSGFLPWVNMSLFLWIWVQNNLSPLRFFIPACSSGKPIRLLHAHSSWTWRKRIVYILLKYSHTNVLSQDTDICPVYPTEVVFALDMSEGVTPAAFERMRNIVMSLLKTIKISESNCPTGARVSIVSFNTNIRYLIRFSEFQKHNLLLQAVQRIPLERSTGKRSIGTAMRFVARNVFKRVRQGILTRKVAIFFASGPSQEDVVESTAVLELSAWDITPVIIAFTELPNVRRAFSVSRLTIKKNWISC